MDFVSSMANFADKRAQASRSIIDKEGASLDPGAGSWQARRR